MKRSSVIELKPSSVTQTAFALALPRARSTQAPPEPRRAAASRQNRSENCPGKARSLRKSSLGARELSTSKKSTKTDSLLLHKAVRTHTAAFTPAYSMRKVSHLKTHRRVGVPVFGASRVAGSSARSLRRVTLKSRGNIRSVASKIL